MLAVVSPLLLPKPHPFAKTKQLNSNNRKVRLEPIVSKTDGDAINRWLL